MSNDASPAVANASAAVGGNSPTVALFQKAHAKMITLQRVDEQFQLLAEQRKKLLDEIRGIQTQINSEFDRLLHSGDDALPKLPAAAFAPDVKFKRNGKDALRMEVAQAG